MCVVQAFAVEAGQLAAHWLSVFWWGLMKVSSVNRPCLTASWLRSSRS